MKDTKFMTAKEKNLVLTQWQRFIKELTSDRPDTDKLRKLFTKRLYSHLNQHCSFIAHYNCDGFFRVYFTIGESTVKFIRQFDADHGFVSCEYGNDYWYKDRDYSDLNTAMCEAIEQVKAAIYRKCQDTQEQHDIAEARRLLAKHGYDLIQAT